MSTNLPQKSGRASAKDWTSAGLSVSLAIVPSMTTSAQNEEARTRALSAIARNTRGSTINRGLILAALLVALDVMLVAHLQQPATLAILRYTPPVTLFTGVLVNLAPVLLPAAVFGLAALALSSAAQGRASRAAELAAVAIIIVVLGYIFLDESLTPSPWFWLWLAVGSLVVGGIYRWQSWFTVDGTLFSAFVLMVGLSMVINNLAENQELRNQLSRPYIPAEIISLQGEAGMRKFTGYVLDLDQSGAWTTILVDQDRSVIIVRSESVTSRTVCPPEGVEIPTPRWTIIEPQHVASIEHCDA